MPWAMGPTLGNILEGVVAYTPCVSNPGLAITPFLSSLLSFFMAPLPHFSFTVQLTTIWLLLRATPVRKLIRILERGSQIQIPTKTKYHK